MPNTQAPALDVIDTVIADAEDRLLAVPGMTGDKLKERLDTLRLQLQIDLDPSHGVKARSLNDHPLGFGRLDLINSLAQAARLELERGLLIEGTNFEHILVECFRENGVPAWMDGFGTNPGSDVYVSKGEPDPEVVAFLESEGGAWDANLCFFKNKPCYRLPGGSRKALPDRLARKVWKFVGAVSLKTKAVQNANSEEFTYDLLHSLREESIGRPKHGRGKSAIDTAWVDSVLGRALEHNAHSDNTVVANYVPVMEGESEGVECTLHSIEHSFLKRRMEEARNLFADPAALKEAEASGAVQVKKTKGGSVHILFRSPDRVSVTGETAPEIRFILVPPDDQKLKTGGNNGKLQVQVHTDETVACSSYVQEVPVEKRDFYREQNTIARNQFAEDYRAAMSRGEPGPKQKLREWYRLR